MLHALRKRVIVQAGGLIEIHAPEMQPGTEAAVIILEDSRATGRSALRNILGSGQGAFSTPEQADAFLRGERESWE